MLVVHQQQVQVQAGTFDFYQRGAYALGPTWLMVRWGDPAMAEADASIPVLATAPAHVQLRWASQLL